MKKLISIVTPCYNEEENVLPLYEAIKNIMETYTQYDYEHIYIDNCSTDKTFGILRELSQKDKRVKVIGNARNFGHIRSPYYGVLQSAGDCTLMLASDFQDPPERIPEFIAKWEEGYKVVVGVKKVSKENPLMFWIRKQYYKLVRKLSDVELIDNFTGFGLYDKIVIDAMRKIEDPYPYFRGLICEIGFERATIEFTQPRRVRGVTKNNFYTLYDMAMLGITSNSLIPLRIATFIGSIVGGLSLVVALVYFIVKLLWWDEFLLGQAPLVLGLFFFSSVQLFFIGLLGEYIGLITTRTGKRPLVVERERLNFNEKPEE